MNEPKSIAITEDGSMTIFNRNKNEHYHSIHGAIQESMHVFINNGFKHIASTWDISRKLNILEVGFGTGLNSLLTLYEIVTGGVDQKIAVSYTGIEPEPISPEIASSLNYCDRLNCNHLNPEFLKMHETETDKVINLNERFTFLLEMTYFQEYTNESTRFDLVYFDAFSPAAEPDLWNDEVYKKLYSMMNIGGVMVTYCSKGSVRRGLQQQGFNIERLPGPPGKHEMLRATK